MKLDGGEFLQLHSSFQLVSQASLLLKQMQLLLYKQSNWFHKQSNAHTSRIMLGHIFGWTIWSCIRLDIVPHIYRAVSALETYRYIKVWSGLFCPKQEVPHSSLTTPFLPACSFSKPYLLQREATTWVAYISTWCWYWCTGVQLFKCTGVLVYKCTGVLVSSVLV